MRFASTISFGGEGYLLWQQIPDLIVTYEPYIIWLLYANIIQVILIDIKFLSISVNKYVNSFILIVGVQSRHYLKTRRIDIDQRASIPFEILGKLNLMTFYFDNVIA